MTAVAGPLRWLLGHLFLAFRPAVFAATGIGDSQYRQYAHGGHPGRHLQLANVIRTQAESSALRAITAVRAQHVHRAGPSAVPDRLDHCWHQRARAAVFLTWQPSGSEGGSPGKRTQ